MAVANPSKAADASKAPIVLVDLAAQQKRIRTALDEGMRRVLEHGQYIMGPEVAELERRLAAATGAKHAITCASGTDALLIVLLAHGVGPGDAVICPAFTFPATPEAIAMLGATPVFCDVDERSFNMDPAHLLAAIETAREKNLKPKVVMPVDLYGLPADYAAILPIAREHDLFVLCDAAQSFGAAIAGRKVGQFGNATATSFFPAKPLGCYGDGGAIFTDDDRLADVMRSIRAHGKGGDKYEIVRLGMNGRLDTLQAAILIPKLEIFESEVAQRQVVARRYDAGLGNVVTTPRVPDGVTSVWAQYTIKIADGRRDAVAKALASQGIQSAVYYPRPLTDQVAYKDAPVSKLGVAVSSRLSADVLSLPMHPYLEPAQQERVIAAVTDALN